MSEITDADDFERRVVANLVRLGLEPGEAEEVARSRFPACAEDARDECRIRGRILSLDDMTAFLRHKFGCDRHHDGEPLTADSVAWTAKTVGELLKWSVDHGIGHPAVCPDPKIVLVSVEDMLAALRSDDIATRISAGVELSRSLGVGLKLAGESVEDVENLIAPELTGLLGRAMAGDVEAVDELQRVVTGSPALAFRPARSNSEGHTSERDS